TLVDRSVFAVGCAGTLARKVNWNARARRDAVPARVRRPVTRPWLLGRPAADHALPEGVCGLRQPGRGHRRPGLLHLLRTGRRVGAGRAEPARPRPGAGRPGGRPAAEHAAVRVLLFRAAADRRDPD